MQKFYVDISGKYLGSYTGPHEQLPSMFSDAVEVATMPEDGRQRFNFETGLYDPVPVEFEPIEPVPFWKAAWDLLGIKKSDVLASIADPDERYEAELSIDGRKTYQRDDETVVRLATLMGYPPEQMDTLWFYVQTNYS
ncbi:hypothetical protein LZK73_21900 [Neorhizobium galegae]|nr:hypothetical protein LZK73_21900 [Neorhizobium galegae]